MFALISMPGIVEERKWSFRLKNSPSKYSSNSPHLVSPERPISILAQTYFSGKTFLEDLC